MAQFFEETAEAIRWRVVPLAGDAFDLAGERRERRTERGATAHPTLTEFQRAAGPLLVRHEDDARNTETWILLAPRAKAVRVNGRRVLNKRGGIPLPGICMLRHKDCVEFDAPFGVKKRLFPSTERLATVEPFTEAAGRHASGALVRASVCPRCKQRIEPQSPAVRCPQCQVVHHQTAELPCWSYARTCALCSQATDLPENLSWTPEDL